MQTLERPQIAPQTIVTQMGQATSQTEVPHAHPLTRYEYQLLTEAGAFEGRRVELIGGVIYEKMASMRGPHATAVTNVTLAFVTAFARQAAIRIQLPVTLDETSEPEPDLALARGEGNDYSGPHPTPADVLFLLEISDATLLYDRYTKASIYARAEIVEYWILNVPERQLEIHRGPQRDSAMPFGWGYSTRLIVPESGSAATLWQPEVEFAVADLLPRTASES